MAAAAILDNFEYIRNSSRSTYIAFAIAQLSCYVTGFDVDVSRAAKQPHLLAIVQAQRFFLFGHME